MGVIIGQQVMMSLFDPEVMLEESYTLSRLSYEAGCDAGSLNLTTDRCKELSFKFIKAATNIKKE